MALRSRLRLTPLLDDPRSTALAASPRLADRNTIGVSTVRHARLGPPGLVCLLRSQLGRGWSSEDSLKLECVRHAVLLSVKPTLRPPHIACKRTGTTLGGF